MFSFLKLKEEFEILVTDHPVRSIGDAIRKEIGAKFVNKQFNFSGELSRNMSYVLKDKISFMVFRPSVGPFVFLEVSFNENFKSDKEKVKIEVKKRLGKTFYIHFWFPIFFGFIAFLFVSYIYLTNSSDIIFNMLLIPLIFIFYGMFIYIVAYFKMEGQASRFKKLLKSNAISFSKMNIK
ncbi:MAG: hypothetical protein ACI9Y7_000709 [Dokdonia sp.]|jgi:hypothetical protein